MLTEQDRKLQKEIMKKVSSCVGDDVITYAKMASVIFGTEPHILYSHSMSVICMLLKKNKIILVNKDRL